MRSQPLPTSLPRCLRLPQDPARYSYLALSTFFRDEQARRQFSRPHCIFRQDLSTTAWNSSAVAPKDQADRKLLQSPSLSGLRLKSIKLEDSEKNKKELLLHVSSYPKSLRKLAMSLPSSGFRRPSKEEYVERCIEALFLPIYRVSDFG